MSSIIDADVLSRLWCNVIEVLVLIFTGLRLRPGSFVQILDDVLAVQIEASLEPNNTQSSDGFVPTQLTSDMHRIDIRYY